MIGCVWFRSDLDSGDGVSEEEEEGHYSQYDELGRTPPRTQLSRFVFVVPYRTAFSGINMLHTVLFLDY